MNPINIGSRREVLWDYALIEKSRTTAELVMHKPRIEEIVLVCDAPWEGDGCNSFSIIKDGDLYRMYYLAWKMMNEDCTKHLVNEADGLLLCYAESTDGIHWVKPDLGLCAYDGDTHNNILLTRRISGFDDMIHVFYDENPACPPEEKYKAIGHDCNKNLSCCVSADGIHFKKGWALTDKGMFDTHNIAFWSPEFNCYFAYIRDFHDRKHENDWNSAIRDVRWMTSSDFKTWTDPVLIDFGGDEDYPLYTNEIQRYPRAPHMLIGFPLRYMERKQWTENVAQLPNADRRAKLCKVHPRYGLSVTDSVFMTSRDGKTFHRFDEAFLSPDIERGYNWVYGDAGLTYGLIETKSPLRHAPDEYSLYSKEMHWSGQPAELRRYTIRKDGFCSFHAPYGERKLFTRPIIFDGSKMELNFSTSARGYVYVTVHGRNSDVTSCELFGNALDRTVPFDGDLAALSGQEVVLEFTLRDADLYSFRFFNE